ncbi:hypothetical protein SAMN05444362_101438 [Dysgonomonas macrotermitis]|uniref:Uncharacterized protein n=1 Tax=Dysgonomonas macrotermitis TaxID=1346286 RepID=A0A1M4TW90_9BACT|nr:hypothetical protein SAMN05444362_101438 [Dysgonomonas macrotermitis]
MIIYTPKIAINKGMYLKTSPTLIIYFIIIRQSSYYQIFRLRIIQIGFIL